MDRKKFIQLRTSLELPLLRSRLVGHMVKDIILVASVIGSWNLLGPLASALIGIPAMAILMFRNFSLMHDAVHGAVIRPRWFNDIVGIWSGGLSLLPFEPWRNVHLRHHQWAGNIDRDPVMVIVRDFPKWPIGLQKTLSFLWRMWIPLIAVLQYGVFWYQSMRIVLTQRPSALTIMSVMFPLVGGIVLLAAAPGLFVLTQVLPALLLYFVAVEVVNFPHHLELPQYRGDTKLQLWEQHRIARSCLYPKWMAENIVLNFNYHLEHHLYPGVPWYHLHQIHEVLRPELGAAYNTDLKFAWIMKNRPRDLAVVLRAMEQEEDEHSISEQESAAR